MNEIEKLLASLDSKVKRRIEKLLDGLTEQQRNAILTDPKLLDELLSDINTAEIVRRYQDRLIFGAGKVIQEYKDDILKVQTNKVNIYVNSLTELKTELLKDFIITRKDEFKTKMFEYVTGRTKWNDAKEYFTKTPFTGSQIGTLLNTSESDIRRQTTLSLFEDDPTIRYKYVGGILPTSSKICMWLMQNQKPEGYTLKEIQEGIETPEGKVDWNGRIPNYNCIHSWQPIIKRKAKKK